MRALDPEFAQQGKKKKKARVVSRVGVGIDSINPSVCSQTQDFDTQDVRPLQRDDAHYKYILLQHNLKQ